MQWTPPRLIHRCVGLPSGRNFSSNSRNCFGIDSEYVSLRGLGIARRVFSGMSELARYIRGKPRIFVSEASDEACSSMYVLSQFPMAVQVDLPEFVRSAERVAHTVLQRLYGHEVEETKEFLARLATPESLQSLLYKPSAPIDGERKERRVILEQLNVNSAALGAVEYTRERVEENVTSEWLTLQVQYNVTEHLLIEPIDGTSCEDRRVINTRFGWTFEADVTNADEVEWGIVAATPFDEKPAVVKARVLN